MDDAATEEAPRPRRGLLGAALTIGALGLIGFAAAGVSAGQYSSSGSPGGDGTALPVQQRDGERGDGERRDGDCPFKDRGQQGRPGEAAPRQQGSPGGAAPDDRSVSL